VGGGRRLHKEELRNLFALPDIIRVIWCRRIWWTGHVKKTPCGWLVGWLVGYSPSQVHVLSHILNSFNSFPVVAFPCI
jgi:hypothetical protein